MVGSEYPIKIVISAVDKATAEIKGITQNTSGMLNLMAGQAIANLGRMGKALSDDLVNNFADFDAAMKNSISIMNGGVEAESKLKDLAEKLGVQFGISSQTIAEGYYQLASAGYDANQVLQLTPGILQLSKATMTDFYETATVTTGVIDAWGLSTEKTNEVTNELLNIVKGTKTTLSELEITLGYTAGSAASLGINLSDLGAAIMMVRKQSIDASMAGTGLRQVMNRLIDPTVREKMAKFGVEIKKNADGTLDFWGTLKNLKAGLQTVGDATEQSAVLTELFGSRAKTVANILLTHIDEYQSLKSEIEETGNLQQALNIQMSSTKSKLEQANEQMAQAKRHLGEEMAPAAIFAATATAQLTNAIAGLPPDLIKVGGGLLLITSQAGSALGPILQAAASLAILKKMGGLTGTKLLYLGAASIAAIGIIGLLSSTSKEGTLIFSGMIGVVAGLTVAKWALASSAWAAYFGELSLQAALTMGAGVAIIATATAIALKQAYDAQAQSAQNAADMTKKAKDATADLDKEISGAANTALDGLNDKFKDLSDSIDTTTTKTEDAEQSLFDLNDTMYNDSTSAINNLIDYLQSFGTDGAQIYIDALRDMKLNSYTSYSDMVAVIRAWLAENKDKFGQYYDVVLDTINKAAAKYQEYQDNLSYMEAQGIVERINMQTDHFQAALAIIRKYLSLHQGIVTDAFKSAYRNITLYGDLTTEDIRGDFDKLFIYITSTFGTDIGKKLYSAFKDTAEKMGITVSDFSDIAKKSVTETGTKIEDTFSDAATTVEEKSDDMKNSLNNALDSVSDSAFEKGKEAGDNWKLGFLFSTDLKKFVSTSKGIEETKGESGLFSAYAEAGLLEGGERSSTNNALSLLYIGTLAKALENYVMTHPDEWTQALRPALDPTSADSSKLKEIGDMLLSETGLSSVGGLRISTGPNSDTVRYLKMWGDTELANTLLRLYQNGITYFASGGLVTQPTLGLIGEAGPELVLPLDRVGVGNTFYINIYADTYEGGQAAADGLTDELIKRGLIA